MGHDHATSRRTAFAGALALAAAAAVAGSATTQAAAEPVVVRVGVPLDLSGSAALADIGESELAGVEQALAEIEESDLLGDMTIELVPVDTKGDKQEAVAAVLGFVEDDVDAIVGFTLTPSFLAAAPDAVESGVPIIAFGLAAPGVTDAGENVFRVIPNVMDLYVESDPIVAESLGATTAAYLYASDSETTVAIHEARLGALEAAGVETLRVQTNTTTDTDFRAQLTDLDSAGADVIVLTAFPGQIAPIFLQAEELGITTPIISSDGSARDDVLSQAGGAMQCTIFNSVWAAQNETGRNPQFVEAFGADADLYKAAGYDALWLYAEALARAGTPDSAAVLAELAGTTDFEGAFGVYSYDENRNPSILGTNLQVQDGEAVVWTPETACE